MINRQRWYVARVTELHDETATVKTISLRVPGWPGHVAGQHVDVRLTAPDGYSAVRSYSIASADRPGNEIMITVERLDDGEVSPYLTLGLAVDDQLELRGPLGGWFVWRPSQTEPVQLVAGGSGVVPLAAMIRSRTASGGGSPMRLLYSVRDPGAVLYADDLAREGVGVDITYAFTRAAPAGHDRSPGRIDQDLINTATIAADQRPTCYVCGPTGFVEHAAVLLTRAGHDPGRVRTERFGGSGGGSG